MREIVSVTHYLPSLDDFCDEAVYAERAPTYSIDKVYTSLVSFFCMEVGGVRRVEPAFWEEEDVLAVLPKQAVMTVPDVVHDAVDSRFAR